MKEDWNCGVSSGPFATAVERMNATEMSNASGFSIFRSVKVNRNSFLAFARLRVYQLLLCKQSKYERVRMREKPVKAPRDSAPKVQHFCCQKVRWASGMQKRCCDWAGGCILLRTWLPEWKSMMNVRCHKLSSSGSCIWRTENGRGKHYPHPALARL